MRHIAILTHPTDHFEHRAFMLNGVVERWRENGNRVTVVTDPQKKIGADLGILHVDRTVIPDEFLAGMAQYPLTINAGVKDISKRAISRNLVRPGDGYRGPVIIKTNRNCGGAAEAFAATGNLFQRYYLAVRRRMHWSWRSEIDTWKYPIFDSPDRVPPTVWLNRDLVVERFLPERAGDLYCMRMWIFLGDADDSVIIYARQPIVKSKVAVRIAPVAVPQELRAMRRKMGFDYGKFDYGIVNGRVVLYDANRSPTTRPKPDNLRQSKVLASGIESMFGPRYRAAG